MSEYGYIPEAPTQSWGNNKGIFTPNDIYDLTRADKYTQYGQVELIETKTVSGTPTTVEFTEIKGNIYKVHFFTYNNVKGNSTTAQDFGFRYSTDGGTSWQSGTDYRWALFDGRGSGTWSDIQGTGENYGALAPDLDDETNATVNGYVYFYNLNDSTKYSYTTSANFIHQSAVGGRTRTGGTAYVTTNTVNAIQFLSSSGGGFKSGTMSLYGMRYYT